MSKAQNSFWKGMRWVPSLYFAEGMPYAIVMMLSTVLYKNLGLSNADITLYTGWLYLPWVIKPLWSPIVDNFKTKRFWIILMQFVLGIGLAMLGLSLEAPTFVRWSLIAFWLIAFSSATHDIAADGSYMLGLTESMQSVFVGVRNLFYKVAFITAQGGLVALSGILAGDDLNYQGAWMWIFILSGAVFVLFALYHKVVLQKPDEDVSRKLYNASESFLIYIRTLVLFFQKKGIIISLLFILFYRFGEAQLTRLAAPFLLDSVDAGGLGLSNESYGLMYGTVGMLSLMLGGILGGVLVSRHGLKFWMWPMALAMKLPDVAYVYLASAQPESELLIQSMIAVEQLGYGFGFTAFTLYLIQFCKGNYKTAHYALATGFMALGMMIPGMFSGWIQEQLGYQNFFVWVLICTIPGLALIPFIKIEKGFGKG